jgi:hypothetical protein
VLGEHTGRIWRRFEIAQADFAANFSFQETSPASRIPINCHRLSGAKKFTPGKGIFSMTM